MAAIPTRVLELEFNKDGAPVHPEQVDALLAAVQNGGVTDLIVMSHGWNNDMGEARDLYRRLRDRLAAQLPSYPQLGNRTFKLAGVLWPSKKFADDELIPGGAAGATDDAVDDAITEQLGRLEETLDPAKDPLATDDAATRAASDKVKADFARLRALVPHLEEFNEPAQIEFTQTLASYLAPSGGAEEEVDEVVPEHLRAGTLNDRPVLMQAGVPVVAAPAEGRGGSASIDESADTPPLASRHGAAGIGDFIAGVKAGALNVLNCLTYYKMKERAGVIGRNAVNAVLRRVRQVPKPPRIHLIGHSFGGRLVSAAALGPDGQAPVPIATVSLLQAAFSHYGFADNYMGGNKDGFFRAVVANHHVSGPVVITHTRNDKAVGVAYAVASRLARQVGAAAGDEHDKYGGMGSNGAQDTPETDKNVRELNDAGTAYQFAPGRVYNLKADRFVSGHSEIANDQVAYAILGAIATS